MKTGTEKSIYIRVLLWAYEKQQEGFSRDELNKAFSLNGQLHSWVEKTFFAGTNEDRPLIGHLSNKIVGKNEVSFFCLTDKGMSAAIDYLELKEARESSKEAKKIATWSLWIAIGVGIAQILVALCK